jgi:hypothetical protein
MVDELTVTLAELGADVVAVTPFYHLDRKGRGDYLKADGITYTGRTITVHVGSERIDLGLHQGTVKGVRVLFLHHADVFPRSVCLSLRRTSQRQRAQTFTFPYRPNTNFWLLFSQPRGKSFAGLCLCRHRFPLEA